MPRSISMRSLAMPMLVRSRNAMTYAAISSGMMRRKISLLMTAGGLIAVACRVVDMVVTFLLEGVVGYSRGRGRFGVFFGWVSVDGRLPAASRRCGRCAGGAGRGTG